MTASFIDKNSLAKSHIVQFYDIVHSPVSTCKVSFSITCSDHQLKTDIVAEYPDQYLGCIITEKRKRNGTLGGCYSNTADASAW